MRPTRLRLLVLHVSSRCDQACAHCSLWERNGRGNAEWTLDDRLQALVAAREAGAESLLLTGGEPLLSSDAEPLARKARTLGLSVFMTTNGLGLQRASGWVRESVDEVYVSLDGPKAAHDRSRGQGMFERLGKALSAFREGARPRLIARSVVSALNADVVEQTVDTARELGFDRVSFLAFDAQSDAFGERASARSEFVPSKEQREAFLEGVRRLAARGETGAFVVEEAAALFQIASRLETGSASTVRCDAPEWSVVLETDGALRPCFFQPVVGVSTARGLEAVRQSSAYADALAGLGDGNAVCRACVCPKLATAPASLKTRLTSWLSGRGTRAERSVA